MIIAIAVALAVLWLEHKFDLLKNKISEHYIRLGIILGLIDVIFTGYICITISAIVALCYLGYLYILCERLTLKDVKIYNENQALLC